MAQFDSTTHPNPISLLQDLLRLIAQKPQLEEVATVILTEAKSISGAEAAFYIVFDEPRSLFLDGLTENEVPADESLLAAATNMEAEMQISRKLPEGFAGKFDGALFIPILKKRTAISLFGLLFVGEMRLSDEATNMLTALLNGLTIATNIEKTDARHQKLTRNQNEFVRIVSHDLRSPLTSIKGFASMMEADEQDERKRHYTEKILSGVTQMTSLVDNIQDAGRYDPETGFYEMERNPTDLLDMVRGIVKNHLVPAEKEALTIVVDASDDVPIVNVDANMIERSIINLVDNAIKYTPNGGLIKVGVKRKGEDLLITISDNGYGISPENMRQLFQRHFRIRRKEHNRVKGSGLGLFIVRSVARHHGGDAFVESTEGQGSTFGIRIPLEGENLLGASLATEV
jgi:signal transduction histidine kinase